MTTKTITATLLTRSDIEDNFITNNPILAAGEMAISTDKGNMFKVGDGVNTWSDLSYNSVSWSQVVNKPSASSTDPVNVGVAASAGTATNYSREDHTHAIALATGDNNGQVKIAGQNIDVKGLQNSAYHKVFVGTTAEWDQLATEQKKTYDRAEITDDYTDASIGNLNALATTDKSSVVGAINEVNSNKQPKTDNNLQTTSKETTGAINELKSGLTSVSGKMITVITYFNATDQVYPVTTPPATSGQVTILGRNFATGAIYAMWYDSSKSGFVLGNVLVGNNPSDRDAVTLQYFA